MKYSYLVKHNGIYYKAGEEVPNGTSSVTLTDDVPEGALDTNEDGSVNSYDENNNLVGTVSAVQVENVTEIQYKKSDIARMSTADLKELAITLGVEVNETITGAQLKEIIIAKLGL